MIVLWREGVLMGDINPKSVDSCNTIDIFQSTTAMVSIPKFSLENQNVLVLTNMIQCSKLPFVGRK